MRLSHRAVLVTSRMCSSSGSSWRTLCRYGVRNQRAGGGEAVVAEAAHVLAGDRLTLVGHLADHLLHLRGSLRRLHESLLGKVIDAAHL